MSADRRYHADLSPEDRDEMHRQYLDDLGAEELAKEQERAETRAIGCYWCGAAGGCVCESEAERESNRAAGRGDEHR